ncbi:MAG: hypothetical protein NDF55_08340 [archaeon GB-1867-005]|nr:hypothetical protein [Candidatus Culexmicrobium cathedralense]
MSKAMLAYRCERCGAPLEVTPETIVAVCDYCGHPNWMSEVREDIVLVASVSKGVIIREFRRRIEEDFDLSRIKDKIGVTEVSGVYVPFYFVTIKAEATYEGYIKKIERVGRGKKARWITKREIVSGTLRSILKLPVLARRSAEDFSINELAEHYKYSKPELMKLEDVDWEKFRLTVLSAEITSDEAAKIARDEAGDRMRARAESKVDNLTEFHCTTKVLSISPITLLPYWYLVYRFGGSHYRAAYAGWNCHLLAIQEPVLIYHRALYFVGALLGCGISAMGLTFAATMNNLGLSIGLLALGAGISYAFGRRMVSDVRVEKE